MKSLKDKKLYLASLTIEYLHGQLAVSKSLLKNIECALIDVGILLKNNTDSQRERYLVGRIKSYNSIVGMLESSIKEIEFDIRSKE